VVVASAVAAPEAPAAGGGAATGRAAGAATKQIRIGASAIHLLPGGWANVVLGGLMGLIRGSFMNASLLGIVDLQRG
jgi:hypothetical protein